MKSPLLPWIATAIALSACGGVAQETSSGPDGGTKDGAQGWGGGRVSVDAGSPMMIGSPPEAGVPLPPPPGGGPLDASPPPSGGADAGAPPVEADVPDSGARKDGSSGGPGTVYSLDGALPDASASPAESFALVVNGAAQAPLSCPSEHWEFPGPASSDTVLRNTGSVPLAYTAEATWYGGAKYSPGVPTGTPGERTGVLAPGASVSLAGAIYTGSGSAPVALVGAPKPFSIYDGGYAATDEGSIPWPLGVPNSTDATTMYVAFIEFEMSCTPVAPVW